MRLIVVYEDHPIVNCSWDELEPGPLQSWCVRNELSLATEACIALHRSELVGFARRFDTDSVGTYVASAYRRRGLAKAMWRKLGARGVNVYTISRLGAKLATALERQGAVHVSAG